MKNLILKTLMVFSFVQWGTTSAQVTTGRVLFQLEVVALDSAQVKNAKNANGTRLAFYFAPNKNRVDMLIGKMMKMTTVNDLSKDSSLLLTSSQMGNYALSSTISQAAERDKKPDSTLKVELIAETKEIAGYPCKKAIVFKADGRQITHWYTEQLVVNVEDKQFQDERVPGFSLEVESIANGLHTKMSTIKIDTILEASEEVVFSVKFPSGFQQMTWEQYQANKSKSK